MKALRTLYLLAADQNFRLLCTSDPGLAELGQGQADDYPDVRDHFDSSNSTGHRGNVAFELQDRGKRAELERDRFGRHVVDALAAEWAKGLYDRIILSAGPKMLGVLRDAMPEALAAHVAAELHKDLIKIPRQDLPSHFRDVPGV